MNTRDIGYYFYISSQETLDRYLQANEMHRQDGLKKFEERRKKGLQLFHERSFLFVLMFFINSCKSY